MSTKSFFLIPSESLYIKQENEKKYVQNDNVYYFLCIKFWELKFYKKFLIQCYYFPFVISEVLYFFKILYTVIFWKFYQSTLIWN